ncbi:hypothetical protein AB0D78_28475 [Streptomyces avermitilis]|uniref:hypothetical protein n=1 Tax=Streptomyces avermitilis TaxID=33903 RepID=UPI0033CE37A6
MTPDVIDGYLTAGRSLSPIADWGFWFVATFGPGICFVTISLFAWCSSRALWDATRRRRDLRRTPAAPDNQAGRDAVGLWTCRHAWNAADNTTRKETP